MRYAEYSRVATEARSLAKEKLEEIFSYGFESLQSGGNLLWNGDTTVSSLGYTIARQPRVTWHAADQSVVAVDDSIYAEVHVDVVFLSPLWGAPMTNTFSILVQ